MCILIDANVTHHFSTANQHASKVRDWIEARPGRLVIGGRNAAELTRDAFMTRWLAILARAGRVTRIRDSDVDAEEARLVRSNACRSDDPHVVALARTSGARILFSHDRALHEDFGNKNLIDNPRGHVYQSTKHRHLLDDENCCFGRR
jgi:hypothetical protein